MPYWAIAYLSLLAVVMMISLIKDYRDGRGLAYISGELFSGMVGFALVIAYYRQPLAEAIGMFVIPLLVYAIAWDQFALTKLKPCAYADLTETENRDMDRYSKLFAFLFILPCYIAGVSISWQVVAQA
jgi:hypothetical protein